MTQKDVQTSTNVVAGTLLLENQFIHVLIDLGATHSFVTKIIENKLKKPPVKLENLISISLRDAVYVEHLYNEVKISIGEYDIEVNVMPKELHHFYLILGMDWLSNNRAKMDFFSKTVNLQRLDKEG